MAAKTVANPKSILDPAERARALRAARQSKPAASGTSPAPAAASRPTSAAKPSPTRNGPVDRTSGARSAKRRDHLAPKKTGVDHRLVEFQAASRTIKRRVSTDDISQQDGGGTPSPVPSHSDPIPETATALPGEEEAVDAGEKELRASLRGAGEDWMEAIQRKEAEAKAAREEEERRVVQEQAAREQEKKLEAARQQRDEATQARRRVEEDRRAQRNAERLELERREFEDRARAREAELQQILLQAAEEAPSSQSPGRAAERNARKARIAEIMSRVKTVTVSDGEPEGVPAD